MAPTDILWENLNLTNEER